MHAATAIKLAASIDELASEYEKAEEIERLAREQKLRTREQLIEVVERFGQPALKGDKTSVVEGDEYRVKVTHCSQTSCDFAIVGKIEEKCPRAFFPRLFKRVVKFTLADGAHEALKKLPSDVPRAVRLLFARAIRVEEMSPRLFVDRKQGVGGASSAK